MSLSDYVITPLERHHDRQSFDCGNAELNRYLHTQASQDVKRRISSCFVITDKQAQIAGFYTLCTGSIPYAELTPELQKKLPRYPDLPSVLVGRLAIDIRHQGKQLGHALLANALLRACKMDIACLVLVVEAKNQQAIDFYQHFGFTAFQSADDKLYYPLSLFQAK